MQYKKNSSKDLKSCTWISREKKTKANASSCILHSRFFQNEMAFKPVLTNESENCCTSTSDSNISCKGKGYQGKV